MKTEFVYYRKNVIFLKIYFSRGHDYDIYIYIYWMQEDHVDMVNLCHEHLSLQWLLGLVHPFTILEKNVELVIRYRINLMYNLYSARAHENIICSCS